MDENDDQIFSITIQQTSSAYDQDNSNVHPPDSYSSCSSSRSPRNPRRRKSKLERAKEMLLNGQDLPKSYCSDENLFPALVDSLQADYKQIINPKSRKSTSQEQGSSNYNTESINSAEQKQENKVHTYNPNARRTFTQENNNFNNTGKSVTFNNTGNFDNGETETDDQYQYQEYESASEQPNTTIRNINTAVLKSSEIVYRALKRAQEYYDLFLANREKERIQEEIKGRLKSAKNEKRELLQMIDNQENNMREIFKEEKTNLVKKHDREIEKFNNYWESEKKQRNYNKTSDELRLLRRQADLLLNDKQYQESIICQKRADALEAAEIENRRADMANDYDQSLKKLQDKQRKEMKNLTVRQKMKRTEYNAAKNEEITKANTRIAKIENELEKSKDPFFINRIIKSQQMEANSINSFTASKYRNSETVKSRQSGSHVVSMKRPAPRSARNFGKMEVCTGDFNQVPLPPLRTDLLIYKAQTARK